MGDWDFFFKARNINIERNVVKKSTLTAMRFTYTNDLAENTDVCPECNKYFKLSVEGLCKEQTSSLKAERWCSHTFK